MLSKTELVIGTNNVTGSPSTNGSLINLGSQTFTASSNSNHAFIGIAAPTFSNNTYTTQSVSTLEIINAPNITGGTATNTWAINVAQGKSYFGGSLELLTGSSTSPSYTFYQSYSGVYNAANDGLGITVSNSADSGYLSAITIDHTGFKTLLSNTSTGTTSGDIITSGGLGIGGNAYSVNFTSGVTSTVTSGTAVLLTNLSSYQQIFTGSTAQAVYMPTTTSIGLGFSIVIINKSSATLTVSTFSSAAITTISPTSQNTITYSAANGDASSSWSYGYQGGTGGQSVLSVSGTVGQIDVSPTTSMCVVSIDPSYIGQSSITTLGTITTGIWDGTIIAPTYGGTGVNNSSNTITTLGNISFASATAFATTATANKLLWISTANNVSGLTTPASSVLTSSSGSVPTWSSTLSLANGGTGASLTASNGGIVYSNATTLSILSGTSTASQVLLSGASSSPSWSTATYPSSTTSNQVLYSSGTNTIAGSSSLTIGPFVGNPSNPPINFSGYNFTDNTTTMNGTLTQMSYVSLASPTLSATNTGVTTTNAATVYIAGAPTASTNETITNAYSLQIASGNVDIQSSTVSTSTSTGALVVSGGIGIGANSYFSGDVNANNFVSYYSTTTTTGLGGIIYLSSTSYYNQYVSATSNIGVFVMPYELIYVGNAWNIINNSSITVTVLAFNGAQITTVGPTSQVYVTYSVSGSPWAATAWSSSPYLSAFTAQTTNVTMTAASTYIQYMDGSATAVTFSSANEYITGQTWVIVNDSSSTITVSGTTFSTTLGGPNRQCFVTYMGSANWVYTPTGSQIPLSIITNTTNTLLSTSPYYIYGYGTSVAGATLPTSGMNQGNGFFITNLSTTSSITVNTTPSLVIGVGQQYLVYYTGSVWNYTLLIGSATYTSTNVSSSGHTYTLTQASTYQQVYTGTGGATTVVLPSFATNTLMNGQTWLIVNNTAGQIQVENPALTPVIYVFKLDQGYFYQNYDIGGGVGDPYNSLYTSIGYNTINTLALTATSPYTQIITGTQNQFVQMPSTSTLSIAKSWYIVNNSSSGLITVLTYTQQYITSIASECNAEITCISTSSDSSIAWTASNLAIGIYNSNSYNLSFQVSTGINTSGSIITSIGDGASSNIDTGTSNSYCLYIRGSTVVGTSGNTLTSPMGCRVDSNSTSSQIDFWNVNSTATGYQIVGTISTNGSATTYSTTSDYRLKTNVVKMTDGLSKINKLDPVYFNWKHDGTPGQGFIADQLQLVIPDAVTGNKDDTFPDGNPRYQQIDSSFIIASLVSSVQSLSKQVQSLSEQVQSLSERVQSLSK